MPSNQEAEPVSLDKINLVISTVWREEKYLEATLDSLSSEYLLDTDAPVSLMVGSPQTAYLTRYQSYPDIRIIEMGSSVWSWIQKNSVQHRATWNYHRCLTQCIAGERGSLILEDDIRFACGWRLRLDKTLAALEGRFGSMFVLSLYTLHRSTPQNSCLYAEYRRESFGGTQGVYYPAGVRRGFAKYLRRHGVVANENHYDFLLRDYLIQENIPLFVTAPSLIQHMGRNTTGLGTWHQSPDFVEEVTPEPVGEAQESL